MLVLVDELFVEARHLLLLLYNSALQLPKDVEDRLLFLCVEFLQKGELLFPNFGAVLFLISILQWSILVVFAVFALLGLLRLTFWQKDIFLVLPRLVLVELALDDLHEQRDEYFSNFLLLVLGLHFQLPRGRGQT